LRIICLFGGPGFESRPWDWLSWRLSWFSSVHRDKCLKIRLRQLHPHLFIALMMEAVRTSETSVYSNEATRRYIPEDSKLYLFHSHLAICFIYRDNFRNLVHKIKAVAFLVKYSVRQMILRDTSRLRVLRDGTVIFVFSIYREFNLSASQ
jgi:hypothetical protein